MSKGCTNSRQAVWPHWCVIALLLAAAALRFMVLPDVPPGVEHDEVAEMLIAESILGGHHAVFFEEAFGQEPLFLYLVAAARMVFGYNVLALRFVSASVGLLTVAAGTRCCRRLFNMRVAVVTAAGLSVMLWPVFWSRVGLRGMLLPLMMSLGVDALWGSLTGKHPYRSSIAGGFWFGLSAYTYLAARGIPFFLAGVIVLLGIFDRARLRRRWRYLLLLCVLAALIALPLVLYLSWNKDAQSRVYEVDAPLRALRAGNPVPVLENVPRILGMVTVEGDATERNNLPRRPVFVEPVWSLLFYVGLGVALGRLSDVRHSLLLVWASAMVLPSLVTTEAPNFVRTLGALPAVMALPAVGADHVRRWLRGRWRLVGTGVLAVAILVNVVLTARAYFVQWVALPEVGFVWQSGLRDIAAWLDARRDVIDVTVGGLSATVMDSASLDLMLQRDDVVVRWCDPGSPLGAGGGMVLPESGGPFLLPAFVPLNPELIGYVNGEDAIPDVWTSQPGAFEVIQWARGRGPDGWGDGAGILFEGGVRFLSLSDADGGDLQPAIRGETVTLFTVWGSAGDAHPDLKGFVHILDGTGMVRAQHDGLDCPTPFWRDGDRVVQRHVVPLSEDLAPGFYTLSVGLYDRETLAPYGRVDGQLIYEAGILEIRDP